MLLIEVSESSLLYDTEVKLPLYGAVGIPEVWIIDVIGTRLQRYANPVDGKWSFEDSPTQLVPLAPQQLNKASLDLSALFS